MYSCLGEADRNYLTPSVYSMYYVYYVLYIYNVQFLYIFIYGLVPELLISGTEQVSR
jgi:hypothetical protein